MYSFIYDNFICEFEDAAQFRPWLILLKSVSIKASLVEQRCDISSFEAR